MKVMDDLDCCLYLEDVEVQHNYKCIYSCKYFDRHEHIDIYSIENN